MNEIINILLISWFLTTFEPLHWLVNTLDKIKKNSIIEIVWTICILPLSCMKCCAFWLGLITTGNLYTAIAASLIAYLFGIIEEKLKWINL